MRLFHASPADSPRCILGEGPVYNRQTGTLSFVDIKTGTLYELGPDGRCQGLQTGQYLGAALPTDRGGYVALMTTGAYLIRGGQIESLIDRPEDLTHLQRFNDAKTGPGGYLFAGSMPLFAARTREGGILYRMERGGRLRAVLTGISVPNGMAWSPDGHWMYFIDTGARTVYKMDYQPDTGELGSRTPIYTASNAYPDGMTADDEGMLWVAMWGAGEVRRIDPGTGGVLASVRVPAHFVSSCCFGGPQRDRLFITTAAEDEPENPLAGRLFAAEGVGHGPAARLFREGSLDPAAVSVPGSD